MSDERPQSDARRESDADWLAFRYHAGDMSVDETAEFERLLGESQPAREALARAVLLAEAVALAAKADAPKEESKIVYRPIGRAITWGQRLAWAALGAAASLIFAGGLDATRGARQAGHPASPADDLAGLAVQWRAAGDFNTDDQDDAAANIDHDSCDSSADNRSAATARDSSDDLAVPDWLLAAVGERQMPPMGTTDGD
jgi:hypothetical protein